MTDGIVKQDCFIGNKVYKNHLSVIDKGPTILTCLFSKHLNQVLWNLVSLALCICFLHHWYISSGAKKFWWIHIADCLLEPAGCQLHDRRGKSWALISLVPNSLEKSGNFFFLGGGHIF